MTSTPNVFIAGDKILAIRLDGMLHLVSFDAAHDLIERLEGLLGAAERRLHPEGATPRPSDGPGIVQEAR